jgi:hypothetical protein
VARQHAPTSAPIAPAMLISVVNFSKRISDQDAVGAVRAANRQLHEDFTPYWHIQATLRLDGRARRVERKAPILGDAILYLSEAADSGDVEGYHTATARGLPFGVVYVDLAEQCDGTWTPTFSHEALELAVDPFMALYAAGPHANRRGTRRNVYYWFEVCDPVQADLYELDGVKLSNFVLPEYFDASRKAVGPHDFLGRRSRARGLSPFGVNAGGYVTFYDPHDRSTRTYEGEGDHEAARRRRIKKKGELCRGPRRGQRAGAHVKLARD